MRKTLLVLVLAVAVLSIPHAMRIAGANPYPQGNEAYGIMREAALVRSGTEIDPLTEKEISPDVHTYLVAGVLGIMPPFLVARLLPFMTGLLVAILFFTLARRLLKGRASLIATVLFLISPAFIYTFTTFNRYYLTMALVLFALLFFVEERVVLCAAVAGLVLLANPLAFILLIAAFIMRPPKDWRRFFTAFGGIVLVAGIIYGLFMRPFVLPVFAFSQYIVDFGAPSGVDVALLLLAAVGMAFVRKRIVVGVLLLLFISLFHPIIILFTCLFLPLLAGIAGDYLLMRTWSLPNLKQLTLLVIICTFLFSFVSFEKAMGSADPQPFFVRAVENIPEGGGNVLAPAVYAPYIRYFAGRRVMSPGREENGSLSVIYQSRELRTTEELLKEERIDTFFVSGEMREGLVWDREGEGLDFLLPHSERFQNVYMYRKGFEAYEVWVYKERAMT